MDFSITSTHNNIKGIIIGKVACIFVMLQHIAANSFCSQFTFLLRKQLHIHKKIMYSSSCRDMTLK